MAGAPRKNLLAFSFSFLFLPHLVMAAPPFAGDGDYALVAPGDATGIISTGSTPSFFHGSNAEETNGWTLEFWWYNPGSSSDTEPIFQVKRQNVAERLMRLLVDDTTDQLEVQTDDGGFSLIGTTPGTTSATAPVHLAIWWRRSGANAVATVYTNGVEGATTSLTWTPPNSAQLKLRIFQVVQTGFTVSNVAMDNLRIWAGPRTEQEIQETMHKSKLNLEDYPNLESNFRFENGVASTYTNHGADTQGMGGFTNPEPERFISAQLEVTPGYGFDTETGLSLTSSVDCEYSFPLIGGDVDGDEVTFVIDAVPGELVFEDTTTTGESLPFFPAAELSEPVTAIVEYHAEAGGESSLKTRAYIELTPGSRCTPTVLGDSDLIPVIVGTAGFVLVLGMIAVALFGRDSDGRLSFRYSNKNRGAERDQKRALVAGGGAGKHNAARKGSHVKEPPSKGATVETKIVALLREFNVSELCSYMRDLIDKGKGQEALLLGVRVEEKAVVEGATTGDYMNVIQQVGDAMSCAGIKEGEAAVKAAKRKTSALTGAVNASQFEKRQLEDAKKTVVRLATTIVGPDVKIWDAYTVRTTINLMKPVKDGKEVKRHRRRSSAAGKKTRKMTK